MAGKIHVYCGDGKGKTTASIGLSVRAAGSGFRILFVQFLKSWNTGELSVLRGIEGFEIYRAPKVTKFTNKMTDEEKAELRCDQDALVARIIEECGEGNQTLVVFDEALGSISAGVLTPGPLYGFLRSENNAEIVLTGRNPQEELLEIADYVSEINKVKHPFDQGVKARKGVEF